MPTNDRINQKDLPKTKRGYQPAEDPEEVRAAESEPGDRDTSPDVDDESTVNRKNWKSESESSTDAGFKRR